MSVFSYSTCKDSAVEPLTKSLRQPGTQRITPNVPLAPILRLADAQTARLERCAQLILPATALNSRLRCRD